MKRRIAAASILVITLTSLAISAQQRTASAPAAPGARSQPTYFPERFEWQHRRPEEVGMNAAVAKLADAANGGGRRAGSREPLKVLGAHPRTEAEIKLMEGRFGPYVTDGTTNATLPKTLAPEQLTLEEAAQLIDERAAKGPAKKKGRRAPAKRKPAKGKK